MKFIIEASKIDDILEPCRIKKYADSGADLSKESIVSAISDISSMLESSSDKVSEFETIFSFRNFFNENKSLNRFKKVAKIFGFDVASALKEAAMKVISEIKVSKKISQEKINDIVRSTVLSMAPSDITQSYFYSIFKKFSSDQMSKSSARAAKISLAIALGDITEDGRFKESFDRWVKSQHTVTAISTKIIQWIISYAAFAARFLDSSNPDDILDKKDSQKELELDNAHKAYEENFLSLILSASGTLVKFPINKIYENDSSIRDISQNTYHGSWQIEILGDKYDFVRDMLMKWAFSVYKIPEKFRQKINSSSGFKKMSEALVRLIDKYTGNLQIPISVSKKQIVDFFISEIDDDYQALPSAPMAGNKKTKLK
jgi:hypothetical protein